MTVPNVQLSLVLCLVEDMKFTEKESTVGCLAELVKSVSFIPSFTRLSSGMRKMCSTNRESQTGTGMTKLLCSSLFKVFMTLATCLLIEGLLPAAL